MLATALASPPNRTTIDNIAMLSMTENVCCFVGPCKFTKITSRRNTLRPYTASTAGNREECFVWVMICMGNSNLHILVYVGDYLHNYEHGEWLFILYVNVLQINHAARDCHVSDH